MPRPALAAIVLGVLGGACVAPGAHAEVAEAPRGMQVVLDDPLACVDKTRLDAELQQIVPADAARGRATLVTLRLLEGRISVFLELRDQAPAGAEPLLKRQLEIARGDCPTLPGLVAVIVARTLEDLPRHRWQDLPPPEPPGRRVRVGLDAGVSLGVTPLGPRGVLRFKGAWGRVRGPQLVVGLSSSVGGAEPLGAGSLRGADVALGAGVAFELAAGGIRVIPTTALWGGVSLGFGSGFVQDETAALPYLAIGVGADLMVPLGAGETELLFGLDLRGPLTISRYRDAESGETWEEPPLRVMLVVGLALSTRSTRKK